MQSLGGFRGLGYGISIAKDSKACSDILFFKNQTWLMSIVRLRHAHKECRDLSRIVYLGGDERLGWKQRKEEPASVCVWAEMITRWQQ